MKECVKTINNNGWIKFKKTEVFCQKCYQIFIITFMAKYDQDIDYPNGQTTHLYSVKKLNCPNCNENFTGVEFYHGCNDIKAAIYKSKRIYTL